jgi:hypothetical protein
MGLPWSRQGAEVSEGRQEAASKPPHSVGWRPGVGRLALESPAAKEGAAPAQSVCWLSQM